MTDYQIKKVIKITKGGKRKQKQIEVESSDIEGLDIEGMFKDLAKAFEYDIQGDEAGKENKGEAGRPGKH